MRRIRITQSGRTGVMLFRYTEDDEARRVSFGGHHGYDFDQWHWTSSYGAYGACDGWSNVVIFADGTIGIVDDDEPLETVLASVGLRLA